MDRNAVFAAMTALLELRRQRRQRMAVAVHALGARVVYELLDEIGRDHGITNDLDDRLQRYAALNPSVVRAVGADRFPAPPAWLVRRR
jgi:hypothetical protein